MVACGHSFRGGLAAILLHIAEPSDNWSAIPVKGRVKAQPGFGQPACPLVERWNAT